LIAIDASHFMPPLLIFTLTYLFSSRRHYITITPLLLLRHYCFARAFDAISLSPLLPDSRQLVFEALMLITPLIIHYAAIEPFSLAIMPLPMIDFTFIIDISSNRFIQPSRLRRPSAIS
jgi:hypothetical protein